MVRRFAAARWLAAFLYVVATLSAALQEETHAALRAEEVASTHQHRHGHHGAEQHKLPRRKKAALRGQFLQLASKTGAKGKAKAKLVIFSTHDLPKLAISSIFVFYFGACSYVFGSLYGDYCRGCDKVKTEADSHWRFSDYLTYRFSHWFVWTNRSDAIFLGVSSMTVLVIGAAIYCIVFDIGQWTGFAVAVWKVFSWLVDPGAGLDEQGFNSVIMGACFSVLGLIVFALLLTLAQEAFNEYTRSLREGTSAVMENDHILIVGYTDETLKIVQELCEAHSDSGGAVIVLLVEEAKPVVEAEIRRHGIDLKGSRVVVRNGVPNYVSSLKHVAADACKTVILLPSRQWSKEVKDAYMMSILVALRGEGWPLAGRILLVCSLKKNIPIFERIGGAITDVLILDEFLAKLIVRSSEGLGKVLQNIIGFRGSEFYLRDVPQELVGLTFHEAAFRYPRAVLVGYHKKVPGQEGVATTTGVDFGGDPDLSPMVASPSLSQHRRTFDLTPRGEGEGEMANHVLSWDDELVMIAEDNIAADYYKTEPYVNTALRFDDDSMLRSQMTSRHRRISFNEGRKKPEMIMIFGWNGLTVRMLLELDKMVGRGSKALTFCSKDSAEQERLLTQGQRRWEKHFTNIQHFTHVKGQAGSRYQLEELPIKVVEATQVYVLSDEDADSRRSADIAALTTVLQLRDLISQGGCPHKIHMIPEIRDPWSDRQCLNTKIHEYVDSSGLPAQIIATMAYQPKMASVLMQLISDGGGAEFVVASLEEYLPHGAQMPPSLSFNEAMEVVFASGDVVIGWTVPWEESMHAELLDAAGHKGHFHRAMHDHMFEMSPDPDASMGRDWEINPNKTKQRPWHSRDKLIVIR
eukprot:TRINITY_DN7140_c0_g2_i1.p1 TRINITY_DN7140_c0_g2~~TRINITY_DN7140_c0_g2_i1.p1  ORF type:complete len:861 (+),score=176.95 TRINITY_DN7140_c0_g2_i1:117-2699(+)